MSYLRQPAHGALGGWWGDLLDATAMVHGIDPVAIRGYSGVSTGSGVTVPTASSTSPLRPPSQEQDQPPAAPSVPFYKNPLIIAAAVGAVYLYTRRPRGRR